MEMMVQVQDEQEAYLLKRGLEDECIKAFVKICAALKAIPDSETDADDAAERRRQVLHAAVCLFGDEDLLR